MLKGTRISLPAVGRDGGKVRIACVGDSITEGWMSSDPKKFSYPAELSRLLGKKYDVHNYGIGGSTLMRCSDQPYRDRWGYIDSIADKPDVVLLMLGTNDANRDYNIRRLDGFYADFVSMINEYRQVGATVVVLTSPALFCNENDRYIRRINAWQKEAAARFGCPVIDVNAFSRRNPGFFPDNVHGDDSGYTALARFIWHKAFGGDLCEVEVTSVPGAAVTLSGVRIKADEDGVARFAVPQGNTTLHSFHIGYHSASRDVTISGDARFDVPLASGGDELARHCPATASSYEAENLPSYACDGHEWSRWASVGGLDQEWITIDLGREYTLTGVCLLWETAFGKIYEIQTSVDGKTFTTAAVVADGTGGVDEVELAAGTRGRYVRMQGRERGTVYGYSLYDFLVFGKK